MKALATTLLTVIQFAAQAPPSSPPSWSIEKRAQVPIHEETPNDGIPRYSVPIRVGSGIIEVGLDTGSSGLRLLLSNPGEYGVRLTQSTDYIKYGDGLKLEGHVAHASVALGAASGDIPIQIVESAQCERPLGCHDLIAPFSRFRFMGNGISGRGFRGILGINMSQPADVDHPLLTIGVTRWIVELPRPGQPGSGRLILNPTAAESSGYTPIETVESFSKVDGSLHDALRGCIINESNREKICGVVVLDTGDPGLKVVRAGGNVVNWPSGTLLTLIFATSSGEVHIAEHIEVNNASVAARLEIDNRKGTPQPFILTGVLPYWAYSILYDANRHTIGFKPRPAAPGEPQAFRVNDP